jgi:LAO/AO transport system kinase
MPPAERILQGDRLALARLLSELENQTTQGEATLGELYPHTGNAHIVGVTGAPGTGKSTLVNRLVQKLRTAQPDPAPTVAVIAVDPSSPYSGGAILGDRIRMRDLAGDPGVFIRSMASRGKLGGLAGATGAFTMAFDAAGYEVILIETVGAGQAEVDVASRAHTTIVIDAPGLGDDVQANKAGILEIADILVVNKSDLPGAERTLRTLELAMHLAQPASGLLEGWDTPVLATAATTGEGIDALAAAIASHRQFLLESGGWGERERLRTRTQLEQDLAASLMARFLKPDTEARFDSLVQSVVERKLTPRAALDALLGEDSSSRR